MMKHSLRTLCNQKGNTLIGALGVMVVLAYGAMAVVNLSSVESTSYVNSQQGVQALAVGNAGIQWALDKVDNGESPDTTGKVFAQGSFDVVSDPDNSEITVTSYVGNAKKVQTLNADFSWNCVDLDVSETYTDGEQLRGIKLVKTCNTVATVESVSVDWDWSSCATGIGCEGDQEGVGDPPSGKFWICHVPPGNPDNAQTLSVNQNGWDNGHSGGTGKLHNMDYLGACVADVAIVSTCEPTNAMLDEFLTCTYSDGGAAIDRVDLDGANLFAEGDVPSVDTVAALDTTTIDVDNYTLLANDDFYFVFYYDTQIVEGGWYTVTVTFADGSTLTKQVRAGTDAGSAQANTGDGFSVASGTVTVEPEYLVTVDVVGAAMTCGSGGAEVNVNPELCIDGSCSVLFSGGDVDGGETYSVTNVGSNKNYTVKGHAFLSSCANFNRTYESTNIAQVKTLMNGQNAPALEGFGGQQSLQEFLNPYLDNSGRTVIAPNQVILLFELGTTDTSSTAADFQDMVVLLTIDQVVQ